MRCVVTGGSGFIGRNLLGAVTACGRFDEVVSLDRVAPPHPCDGVRHVQLDIRRGRSLRDHLSGTDVVFHLAAAANVDRSAATAVDMIEDNIGATAVLLEASRAAGVQRFVFASTVWVYMGVDGDVLTEDLKLLPGSAMNLYATTKLSAELLCYAYREQFGLPCTVLRFETPYGPYMRPELAISRFLAQALNDEPITITGDGRQTRNFIHVTDLVRGAVAAALSPVAAGRTYNLPGPDAVSIRELAELVCRVVRSSSTIRFVPGRENDSRGPQMSARRAQAELAWIPRIRISDGIRDVIAWLARSDTDPVSEAYVEAR